MRVRLGREEVAQDIDATESSSSSEKSLSCEPGALRSLKYRLQLTIGRTELLLVRLLLLCHLFIGWSIFIPHAKPHCAW